MVKEPLLNRGLIDVRTTHQLEFRAALLFGKESEGSAAIGTPGGSRRRRFGKFAGAASGGGGVHRRLVGMALRGQKYPSSDARKAAFREANQKYRDVVQQAGEPLERAVEEGAAGTIAHRAGGSSFGGSKRRRLSAVDIPVPSGDMLVGDENRMLAAIILQQRSDERQHM